jgi:hypothetical protein
MSDLFEVKPIKADAEDDYYNLDVTLDTEREDVLKKYEASSKRLNSEAPSSIDDVDDTTLSVMFGDNWDGRCSDLTDLMGGVARELAMQMTMYSSLGDFLDDQINSLGNQAYVGSGLYQLNQAAENTRMHYESLVTSFSNFKSFSNITGNTSNILYDTDAILANMASATSTIMNMKDKVEDAVAFIQSGGAVASDEINEMASKINGMVVQQDLGNMLASFPHSVVHKFVNSDFAQDVLTMPKQLYSKLTNILTILSSVKAPTNLETILDTILTLREAVAEMKDAITIIERGTNAITTLKNNIANGNYIGAFTNLQGACKFVEKTSCFAAKYPYNQSYETEGGHIFETDNTPGHERLHIQHCTGTDVEIAPNGDMVSKMKNDCQFIVEKDFQNHVKGNQLLLVDNTAEIESKTMKFTATEDLNISAKKTTYTSDKITILADDTLISNNGSLTLATNSSSSISSCGPMYITSDSQIIIDAPSILIGSGRTSLINMNSTSTNVKSDSVFVSDGLIKMKGFITLN